MILDLLLVFAVFLNFTAIMINPASFWWHVAIMASLIVALMWRVR
jgi:hypothetical protein